MSKHSRKRSSARGGDPTDRAWADYTEAFRTEVLPALLESAYLISIGEDVDPDTLDLRAATEMGLMLLLDKPLILVIPTGVTVPAALKRAAHVVLDDLDMTDPNAQARVVAALRPLVKGAT